MEVDAEEVFVLMRREFRVSRNVRAWWFFQHIDRTVSIENSGEIDFDSFAGDRKLSITPHDDDPESHSADLAVVGAVPRYSEEQDATTSEDNSRLVYRIRPDTVVTFLSKYYRLVFILDLSVSLNTIDLKEEQVLHAKAFNCLKGCLEGVIKKFKIPGGSRWFSPQVYVTVMAYTPFLCCPADQVLLQGCLLTGEALPRILDKVSNWLTKFLDTLAFGVRPWLRRWDLMERKRREEKDNEPITGNLFKTVSQSASDEEIKLFQRNVSMEDAFFVDSGPLQGLELGDQISGYHPGLTPMDWNLIRMLRFGLLGIQLLPENTQASIIVITDGVVSVPNAHALNGLLTQLRSYTVSCSFVQIQPKLNTSLSSVGHIAFPELLEFMANATFGSYIPDCPCTASFERSTVRTPEREGELNVFHRSFLCWSFFRMAHDHKHLKRASYWPDRRFFPNYLIRKQRFSVTLDSSLAHILYVRLREGYTIKRVWYSRRSGNPDSKRQICVELKLGWRPQVSLEYHVTAEWPPTQEEKPKVEVKVWVEAPYEFQHDIFVDGRKKFKPYRLAVLNAFNTAVETLTQADRLMIHLHSFQNQPLYYTLPESVRKGRPVFYMSPNSGIPEITSVDLQASYAQFCAFWKPVCTLDVNIWQKWLHTHSLRVILTHDVPLSQHLHVCNAQTGRYSSVTSKQASNELYKALTEWASFTLMEEHSYVKFEYGEDNTNVPEFYYIIRTCLRPPCVALKIAFLGGIRGAVRNKIMSDLKALLLSLRIKQRRSAWCSDSDLKQLRLSFSAYANAPLPQLEVSACTLLQKPAEKVLVRYEDVPKDLYRMVRLEEAVDENDARILIVHNTLAGYLPCRRWMWSLKGPCESGFPISNESAGYILQAIVKRRLNEGFRFALSANGIMNMVRELTVHTKIKVDDETTGARPITCLIQYIIFHPISATRDPWSQRYRQWSLGGSKRASLSLALAERLRRDSQCSEMLSEVESIEADLDTQLVTELWTEPQEGKFVIRDGDDWLKGCTGFKDLHEKIFEADKETIECLATFEHLRLICDEGQRRHSGSVDILSPSPSDPASKSTEGKKAVSGRGEKYVVAVPSCFDLGSMLKHCQQATLLFSSFSYQRDSETLAACNKLLMECFHRELRRSHDAHFRPLELDPIWNLIAANLMISKEIMEKNRWILRIKRRLRQPSGGFRGSFLPSLTIYVKKIDDGRLVVLAVPTNFEDVHQLSGSFEDEGKKEIKRERTGNSEESMSSSESGCENDIILDQIIDSDRKFDRSESNTDDQLKRLTIPVVAFNCFEPVLAAAVSKETGVGIVSHFFEDFQHRTESVLTSLHRQVSRHSQVFEGIGDSRLEYQARAKSRSISIAIHQEFDFGSADNHERFSFPAYCGLLESTVYAKSYVYGVYSSLRRGLNVPEYDLTQAVDGKCEEFPLQVGLTEFVPEICKHFAAYKDTKENEDSSRRGTMDSTRSWVSGGFTVGSPLTNFDPPASFCSPTCSGDHEPVRESFELLLGKCFKKVPCSSDFYYYCPPQAERDNETECSDPCIERVEDEVISSDEEKQKMNGYDQTNEPEILSGEEAALSIEFRSIKADSVGITGSTFTPRSPRSRNSRQNLDELNLSPEASMSDDYSDVDDPDKSERECPIFLQMTCSAKIFPDIFTCGVDGLPVCMAEILRKSGFEAWDRDLRSLELELTMHIFTIYPKDDAVDLIQAHIRSNSGSESSPLLSPSKSEENRSFETQFLIGGPNTINYAPSSPMRDGKSGQVLFGLGPIEETERFHVMSVFHNFPEKERNVLSGIRTGINHLINEERVFALSRLLQENVTEDVLRTVVCNLREWSQPDEDLNVGKSVPRRQVSADSLNGKGVKWLNPSHRYPTTADLPLEFVMKPGVCQKKFMQKMNGLKVGYCQLREIDGIFYACGVQDLDSFWTQYIELHGLRPLVEAAKMEGVAQSMERTNYELGEVAAPVVSQDLGLRKNQNESSAENFILSPTPNLSTDETETEEVYSPLRRSKPPLSERRSASSREKQRNNRRISGEERAERFLETIQGSGSNPEEEEKELAYKKTPEERKPKQIPPIPPAREEPPLLLEPIQGSGSNPEEEDDIFDVNEPFLPGRSRSFSGFPRRFYQQRNMIISGTDKTPSYEEELPALEGVFEPQMTAESLSDLRSSAMKRDLRRNRGFGRNIGFYRPRLFTADSSLATSTNDVTTLGGYEQDSSDWMQAMISGDDTILEQTMDSKNSLTPKHVSYRVISTPFNLGPEPNTEQSQQLVHDFWLIMTVQELKTCVYFHERQKNLHQKLFGQLTEEIKHQMKIVNQEALLEELWVTKRCSDLLLYESKSGNTSGKTYTQNSSGDDSSNPVEYTFPYGSFACSCVWYQWFPVHPRLKLGPHPSLKAGIMALKSLLVKFAVRNRENLYVFKETESDRVYYMRLHDSVHSAKDLDNMFSASGGSEGEEARLPPAKQFETSALLAVHGLEHPSEEITKELRDALQHRLDDAVLAAVYQTLTRNPNCKLSVEDVEFLQPSSKRPDRVIRLTLPSVAIKHLFAVSFYLEQHLLEFMSTPNYMNPSGSAGNQGNLPHRFKYFGKKGTLADDFILNNDAKFYLYHRDFKSAGKGLACVCQSFVDSEGSAVGLIHSDPLDSQGFSSFFPDFKSFDGSFLVQNLCYNNSGMLESLTQTSRMDICMEEEEGGKESEGIKKCRPRHIGRPPALIQFMIWERGEAQLEKLLDKLERSARLALSDLATEYGLMTTSVYRPVTNRNSKESPDLEHGKEIFSEPGTPKRRISKGTLLISGKSASQSGTLGEISLQESKSGNQTQIATEASQQSFVTPVASHYLRKRHSSAAIPQTNYGAPSSMTQHFESETSRKLSGGNSSMTSFDLLQAYIQKATEPVSNLPPRRKHSSGDLGRETLKRSMTADKQTLRAAAAAQLRANSTATAPETVKAARSALGAVSQAAGATNSGIKVQLNSIFLSAAPSWFDHVISVTQSDVGLDVKSKHVRHAFTAERDMGDVRKWSFRLEKSAASSLGLVLYEAVNGLKKALINTELTCFKAKMDRLTPGGVLYELMNTHKLVGLEPNSVQELGAGAVSHVVIGQAFKQWKDTLDYGRNWSERELPSSLKELNPVSGQRVQNFLPLVPELGRGFVPRQRLLLMLVKQKEIVIYGYNWTAEVNQVIPRLVMKLVCWFNARAKLLRQICLQKMGLTHLGNIKDRQDNPFFGVFWTEPDMFIRLSAPPQQQNYAVNRFETIEPIFRQLLTPWRFCSDLCKSLPGKESEVFTDQGLQLVEIRNRLRKVLEEQLVLGRIFNRWRTKEDFYSCIDDSHLKLLIDRSRLVHNVLTPLLFSPVWRQKVAQIRRPMTTAHSEPVLHLPTLGSAVELSSRSIQAGQIDNSRSISGDPRLAGQTVKKSQSIFTTTSPTRSRQNSGSSTVSAIVQGSAVSTQVTAARAHGNVSSPQTLQKAAGVVTLVDSADVWHYQLQHLLAKEYVKYLKHLGMEVVDVFADPTAAGDTEAVVGAEKSDSKSNQKDPFAFDPFGPPNSPEIWLQKTFKSGIVLVKLSFEEPYFIVRMYVWDAKQLPEDLLEPEMDSEPETDADWLKYWSQLVEKSHVHSFSYDFHLKMVAAYLTGGRQVMFRPGYHMNAFLVDFLQYYACRPLSARNCIYEERLNLVNLPIAGQALYNHVLNYNKAYNLTVIRMRVPSASGSTQPESDYLLVSSEPFRSPDGAERYQVLRVVLQDDRPIVDTNGTSLRLKFYVLFISESDQAFPLEPAELESLQDRSSESCSSNATTPGSPKMGMVYHPGFLQRVEQGRRPLSTAAEDDEEEEEEMEEIGEDETEDQTESETQSEREDTYEAHATVPPFGAQRRGSRKSSEPSSQTSPEKRALSRQLTVDVCLANEASESISSPVSPCVIRRRTQSGSAGWEVIKDDGCGVTSRKKISRFEVQRVAESEQERMSEYSASPSKTTTMNLSLGLFAKERSPKRWRQKLSIQRSAPRRHRESTSKSGTEISPLRHVPLGSVLAREQVTYVTYVSEAQRKLQAALEKETERYRETLKRVIGSEASWHCRRDQLWTKLLTPTEAPSYQGHKKRSSDVGTAGDFPALFGNLSCAMSGQEFEALLKFVKMVSLEEIDSNLAPFIADLNASWTTSLMKSLALKYGHDRCRYFACKLKGGHFNTGSKLKHYLIVTNPNFLDSFVMLEHESEKYTSLALVYKDYPALMEDSESRNATKINYIQLFLEDFVSTLTYHFWSKLIG